MGLIIGSITAIILYVIIIHFELYAYILPLIFYVVTGLVGGWMLGLMVSFPLCMVIGVPFKIAVIIAPIIAYTIMFFCVIAMILVFIEEHK